MPAADDVTSGQGPIERQGPAVPVGASPLLEVGRITKPHGVRGEVIVSLTSDRTERVAPAAVLECDFGALVISESRPHQDKWIVKFDGVDDRTAAEAIAGQTLRAAPLDDADALWVHDLIGAEVVTPDGVARGRVTAVEANPAHDILVLDSGAFVPVVFVTRWLGPGRLSIDPPVGLLDP